MFGRGKRKKKQVPADFDPIVGHAASGNKGLY